MEWQGCTKSTNCPRPAGHTARCGRIDKSIPPKPDWRQATRAEKQQAEAVLEVPARIHRVLAGRAPKTELFQRGEHSPYEIVERYALHCHERIPNPGSTKHMISGPCLLEITTHKDGSFSVSVERASHLRCMRIDCGHCNPETD